VARVRVPAGTVIATISITRAASGVEYISELLSDDRLPGAGWRHQGHAAKTSHVEFIIY